MLTQNEATVHGPLTIQRTRYGDDVLVFSLSGEFDLATAEAGKEMLESALHDRCSVTVFDLTELEFIDSCGVALLYAIARSHPDRESMRLLLSRHRGVNRVLELTDVGSVIPIVAA
jgi:anti-anti-sigma factor